MTTARCPACGASVRDGAPWCTLCYADLRAPAPVPAPEPAVQDDAGAWAPSGRHAAVPSSAPTMAPPSGGIDLLDPALDAPVAVSAQLTRGPVTWPCTGCAAEVELEHDRCPRCLTPFLTGADSATTVNIPLVGSLRRLTASKSSRVWLMMGGAVLVCVVLTVVLSLIGLLL